TANAYDLTANRTIALNGAGTIQSNAGTFTVSGVISGLGNLTLQGNGTITLTGANIYSGNTLIQGGNTTSTTPTVNLNGTHSSNGTFTISGKHGSATAVT